jgi:hypothetical protein
MRLAAGTNFDRGVRMSMRGIVCTGVLLAAQLAAAPAFSSGLCEEPSNVADIPSGASATRDQMLSAQRAIKAYDNAVKAYSECLHQSGDTSPKASLAAQRLQEVADRFNSELRTFKQRNGAG